MSRLVCILHDCDDVFQHCIMWIRHRGGVAIRMVGVYRALNLEVWQGAGAPATEMHEDEVSEEERAFSEA